MRRWMAAPLVFAVAVGLISLNAQKAVAQPKNAVAETLRTADGVELHSLFYATDKSPNTAPVVVFLYAPGPDRDMTKGDWGGLTSKLNAEGYHVFQFDWRGHGKSTSIKDPQKFWGNPFLNGGTTNFNAYIKGGPPKMPLKNTFFFKDLTPTRADRYMPAYLNDLAAVRFHLDSKNDNKDLNTSSIYIVGAGDAASLGIAWLTAEWKRPAVFPNVNQLGFGVATYEQVPQALVGGIPSEAGADFGGAVWLTATRPASFPEPVLKRWIAKPDFAPKLRENNPMLFMFAEKDVAGKKQSDWFFNEALVAAPRKGSNLDPLEQTKIKAVAGAVELKGVNLLGQNATLKTEDTIVQYFAFLQKARAKFPSKNRKYDIPYFIDVNYFELKAQ